MKAKAVVTKAGGKMAPAFLAKGEAKTAKPAKAKVLSKPGEPRARMMEGPGMQRAQRGPKGKVMT